MSGEPFSACTFLPPLSPRIIAIVPRGRQLLLADITIDQPREEWIDGDQISASAASALDVDRFVPIVCSGLQSSAGQNYQSPSSFAGLPRLPSFRNLTHL